MNYCTLFDSKYLSRAVAMYRTLSRHARSFHLYIFAFDDAALDVLNKLRLPHTTVVPLFLFEDPELLRVKETRSPTEYCWTCTPSIILYSIRHFGLESCTYIDADLYFFSDPQILIDEMADNSILLTEHNYSPQYDLTATSGKFCVQFMTFRNDETGIKALEWWRKACNEWCYARVEDGKFGDQKYLDDWPTRFDHVHVLKNKGGGVAPWNIQQYDLVQEQDGIYIFDRSQKKKWKIIFFHFHGVKIIIEEYALFGLSLFKLRKLIYTSYELTDPFKKIIYEPYLHQLIETGKRLRYYGSRINFHAITGRKRNIENRIQRLFSGHPMEITE